MNKMKKVLSVIAVVIIIIVCFKADYDRKPHFKVIRGNYSQTVVPAVVDTRININTASLEELDKLEGIGPTIAERIISYRENKPFSSIEDIMNVKGIGVKKYEAIKDLITIN